MKISIVMYHYVRKIKDSKYPRIKGLELDGFRRQLDCLSKEFSIVTVDEILGHMSGGVPLPSNACWLTFDDGYKDHFDYVLPELKKRKLQGSFFPPARPILNGELLDVNAIHYILASCSNIDDLIIDLKNLCIRHGIDDTLWASFWESNAVAIRFDPKEVIFFKRMLQRELPYDVRHAITSILFEKYLGCSEAEFCKELYMSFDEVGSLVEEGMYVGSHTYNHYWLNSVSRSEQELEIDKSLRFLSDVGASTSDWVMSFPYGAYNEETLSILNEKRCAIGLTTKVGIADLSVQSPLELSRFDTNDFPQ